MTDAKLVFSLAENVTTVLEACSIISSKCPVVAFKVDRAKSTPDGIVDFTDLMKISGNILQF